GLVVIGGESKFTGASVFSGGVDIPIIGTTGTIDNDLAGMVITIGYNITINIVTDSVDKIRDTAESHDRHLVIEVMGRDSGLIALRSGISVGAEAVLIPELEVDYNAIMQRLDKSRKNKSSRIVIVAEGDDEGGLVVADKIKENFPHYDVRVSILGHIQ